MSWSERLSGNETSIMTCRCSWVLALFLRPPFGWLLWTSGLALIGGSWDLS
jgi:uncharacterized membrane protein YphA (DoxX/SURF4 family)